ncbi:ATP-binding protein [Halopseudomonas laoshanensis]|uniref:ATP-binding protein n=1 Tax=Halopseudomonas laoshanensis TaxID=2268758 RepID=UPI003736B68C
MKAKATSSRTWRFGLFIAGLFVCFLILIEYGLQAYKDASARDGLKATLREANRLRVLLESEVNSAAFLATGVESYIVARKGDLDAQEIRQILALVFERGRHFRNIGIAPDNRIAWVFPLKGNEAAIGLSYADIPGQWPAIQQIMMTREGRLSGPIDLVQGGRGLIYRSPIFIDDIYWGLLSTVIDVDSLFDQLSEVAGDLALVLALRHIDGDGEPGEVFFGRDDNFEQPLELLSVMVPGANWQMAIKAPASTQSQVGWYRVLEVGIALFLAILLGMLVRLVWQRNLLDQLDSEVRVRTAELRQSHDLLDSVLAAARSFAIIATDAQGTIMLFNKGAERMLGYQASEVVGKHKPAIFLLPTEIRQRVRAMEQELGRPLEGDEVFTLRAQQGIEEVLMLHYTHREGQVLPVQVVVSAIRSEGGDILGYLGIAEDVSERLRNETLKNQFISTVSHELRTPLTAISGALGLVRSGSLGAVPGPLQPMLDIAFNNNQRLMQLVNDLLDIEKLMAGRMALYPDRHAAADLIRNSVEDLQGVAAQHKIELVCHSDPDVWIHVDASRFRQVLTNLLSNAIKFSPAGGTVEIAMHASTEGLKVTVTDEGPGVPPSFHPHLFQRFAQADGGDNRCQAGTGLGLAISKELTEQMGGHIGFEPGASGGSCFWLIFSRLRESESNG